MKPNPTIQKSFAALMLTLFTISFIPKSYFHDIIARHKDAPVCEHNGDKQACAHPKGFQCSFNDLVVSAPYISFTTGFSLAPVSVITTYVASNYQHYLPPFFLGTESRGPPSLA